MTTTPADRTAGPTPLAAVIGLALGPAIGLGFARFAYALVLPAMRTDLGWSFADAGWLNTTNALGYLLGALAAARAVALLGAFRAALAGAFAVVAAMGVCAVTESFAMLNAARTLAGVGAALTIVAGGVLATHHAERAPARTAFLLGVFYTGPGIGIVVSGVTLPFLLHAGGAASWPSAWLALALAGVPMAAGLWLGRSPGPARADRGGGRRAPLRPMGFLLAGYFVFGAGYIAYMTFMIAWVQSAGHGPGFEALFWGVIGLAVMAAPWLWSGVLHRATHGRAFAILTALTAVGAVLPLVSGTTAALLASAALFGSAFITVVAATTAFVRRNLSSSAWASAIGALTVAFGLGQILGPIGTGLLTDLTGGLASGLGGSAALLATAALTGLCQRDPGWRHESP